MYIRIKCEKYYIFKFKCNEKYIQIFEILFFISSNNACIPYTREVKGTPVTPYNSVIYIRASLDYSIKHTHLHVKYQTSVYMAEIGYINIRVETNFTRRESKILSMIKILRGNSENSSSLKSGLFKGTNFAITNRIFIRNNVQLWYQFLTLQRGVGKAINVHLGRGRDAGLFRIMDWVWKC